jgi:DNA end-binding protein Ku
MRPIWRGTISFGLVNIPVELYPATRRKSTMDLRLLRDSDLSPIRYKKVAEADAKEVAREHLVKGCEYERDKFVIVTEEDFKRVEIKSNQTVDIQEFVKLDEIDPRFFDEAYFLGLSKGGGKAYALLRTALEKTGLAAIAKVVIRPPREHLAALKPLDGILVLETMHFADELREPGEVEPPKAPVGSKDLEMALSLIGAMTDSWKPQKYHDEYRESLMKVIEQRSRPVGSSSLSQAPPINAGQTNSSTWRSCCSKAWAKPRRARRRVRPPQLARLLSGHRAHTIESGLRDVFDFPDLDGAAFRLKEGLALLNADRPIPIRHANKTAEVPFD